MQPVDLQQEFNRLSQLYREMAEDELENVAAKGYDLTDIAREALSFEISSRGLPLRIVLERPQQQDQIPASVSRTPHVTRSAKIEVLSADDVENLDLDQNDFIPGDSSIAQLERVHDMQRLLLIRRILREEGIECFLGDARVRDPRKLNESFEDGVEMWVWKDDTQRAYRRLSYRLPQEVPELDGPEDDDGREDPPVRCPKCKSDGVIFEERNTDVTGGRLSKDSSFRWSCDDCGYEWEDDGAIRE
jgi:hypothetical protein